MQEIKKADWVVLQAGTQQMHCQRCTKSRPLADICGKTVEEAADIIREFVDAHADCQPFKINFEQKFKEQYMGEFKPDDTVFTGLYDINKRPICDGDIVFWDDGSNGEWSRIARVYWKKPVLVFKVIASPYLGIIGHEFNYGNFIWKETEKYLELLPSAEAGMEKAAMLRKAARK